MTNAENINVMYFHGKTADGYRYTIAGVVKDEDLHMGVAICSEKDQFSKKIGRKISTGRVLNQKDTRTGRNLISLYSDTLVNEYHKDTGFPENYFVGIETKVFTDFVKHFNHLKQKGLQLEFGILNRSK